MNTRMLQVACAGLLLALTGCLTAQAADEAAAWTPSGWGGGGFYYAAVFHPAQDGVLYMGGDVNGVYKSEDHGRSWRVVNNGLADYGVFSLAVDRTHPQTVYAATESGLCKSTDGAAHWQLLPRTGRQELRITGEKERSIRCIAVDPADGQIVYAGSPAGQVFKSTDGGHSWVAVYQKKGGTEAVESLRVQFGKVDGQYFGGLWTPLAFPAGVKAADCAGFGLSVKGDGSLPKDAFVFLKTAAGTAYRSRNLNTLFQTDQWRDVILGAADFAVDPDFAAKNPDVAKALPATPDWASVNRMDFSMSGALPVQAHVAHVGRFFFALTRAADGQPAPADTPVLTTVKQLAPDTKLPTYGNIRLGNPAGGAVYTVAVAVGDPLLVIAATADSGLVLSRDAGKSWTELPTPKKASSVAIAASEANILYASFFADGVWKSTDKGRTWNQLAAGALKGAEILEVAVSPKQPLDVYAIGSVGWGGDFLASNDGGTSWRKCSQLTPDYEANPTLPHDSGAPKSAALSRPTNIAINPNNPKELFLSANWRPCLSTDGGNTWAERDRLADITCVTDIRFLNGRTYVSAMDEGVLASDDNGGHWRALWPLKWDPALSGHAWRLAVSGRPGAERIVATCSPWDAKYPNRVVISQDGGRSFTAHTAGLPGFIPRANTMWGQGYARALAADPANPDTLYLGIDGDPADGNAGGGVFKSEDGGKSWSQLPAQPASRRMFFGLVVDPADSKRLYWAACGVGGGLHRSEDGGQSWVPVFTQEQWIFNALVAADGAVYCGGQNLWRSADHGATWTQLTKFSGGRVIIGLDADPRDAKTLWLSATTWDSSADGAVYRTRDGGATWQEITGDLPYRKPMVLRFNPDTRELWAGGVGLYRIRQ